MYNEKSRCESCVAWQRLTSQGDHTTWIENTKQSLSSKNPRLETHISKNLYNQVPFKVSDILFIFCCLGARLCRWSELPIRSSDLAMDEAELAETQVGLSAFQKWEGLGPKTGINKCLNFKCTMVLPSTIGIYTGDIRSYIINLNVLRLIVTWIPWGTAGAAEWFWWFWDSRRKQHEGWKNQPHCDHAQTAHVWWAKGERSPRNTTSASAERNCFCISWRGCGDQGGDVECSAADSSLLWICNWARAIATTRSITVPYRSGQLGNVRWNVWVSGFQLGLFEDAFQSVHPDQSNSTC